MPYTPKLPLGSEPGRGMLGTPNYMDWPSGPPRGVTRFDPPGSSRSPSAVIDPSWRHVPFGGYQPVMTHSGPGARQMNSYDVERQQRERVATAAWAADQMARQRQVSATAFKPVVPSGLTRTVKSDSHSISSKPTLTEQPKIRSLSEPKKAPSPAQDLAIRETRTEWLNAQYGIVNSGTRSLAFSKTATQLDPFTSKSEVTSATADKQGRAVAPHLPSLLGDNARPLAPSSLSAPRRVSNPATQTPRKSGLSEFIEGFLDPLALFWPRK